MKYTIRKVLLLFTIIVSLLLISGCAGLSDSVHETQLCNNFYYDCSGTNTKNSEIYNPSGLGGRLDDKYPSPVFSGWITEFSHDRERYIAVHILNMNFHYVDHIDPYGDCKYEGIEGLSADNTLLYVKFGTEVYLDDYAIYDTHKDIIYRFNTMEQLNEYAVKNGIQFGRWVNTDKWYRAE